MWVLHHPVDHFSPGLLLLRYGKYLPIEIPFKKWQGDNAETSLSLSLTVLHSVGRESGGREAPQEGLAPSPLSRSGSQAQVGDSHLNTSGGSEGREDLCSFQHRAWGMHGSRAPCGGQRSPMEAAGWYLLAERVQAGQLLLSETLAAQRARGWLDLGKGQAGRTDRP